MDPMNDWLWFKIRCLYHGSIHTIEPSVSRGLTAVCHEIYRGYYMPACWNEFYLEVFNSMAVFTLEDEQIVWTDKSPQTNKSSDVQTGQTNFSTNTLSHIYRFCPYAFVKTSLLSRCLNSFYHQKITDAKNFISDFIRPRVTLN